MLNLANTALKSKEEDLDYELYDASIKSQFSESNSNWSEAKYNELDPYWTIEAQTLIIEYLGKSKETIIRNWSLLCKSAYIFVEEEIKYIHLHSIDRRYQITF